MLVDTKRMFNISIEASTLLIIIVCCSVPWLLPSSAQPEMYNYFADTRELAGIQNFADVMSNLSFVLAGILGIFLIKLKNLKPVLRLALHTFAIGVIATGAGSAYYHIQPTDYSLVFDRLPMVVAFAGVLGAMSYQLTSNDFASRLTMAAAFLFGVVSVVYWSTTGNITPYATLQFGGLAWLIYGAVQLNSTRSNNQLNWAGLITCYVLAKVFELFDAYIFHYVTEGIVSGHTLKHIIAALGIVLLLTKRASD